MNSSTRNPKIRTIDATALKKQLHDGREIAVLDVREEGVFAKRHLLLAASVPLSRLEIRAPLLAPRRSTRIVLCDGDEGLAQRAAAVLQRNGYTDVKVLDGGVDAWAAQGYEVYSGINVPSKAFGEFVEHHENTPRMPAQEIKARVDAGESVVILDSRPLAEYTKMSIPGGIDCPGAELAFRAHDLIPSPDTLVVVNCAGRTRSIIGAQSLINAGIANRVVALKDGTMGWHLAGFELARGQTHCAPSPTSSGLAAARAAAARVAKRFGVRYIDVAKVAQFAREMDRRTLYLFDVRSPEEFAAGHLHSTVNAPGGLLTGGPSALGRQPERYAVRLVARELHLHLYWGASRGGGADGVRPGRTTGAGNRCLRRNTQCAHRADRRSRRACDHDCIVADPDGVAGCLRGGERSRIGAAV